MRVAYHGHVADIRAFVNLHDELLRYELELSVSLAEILTVRTRLARGVNCHPRTLVDSAGRDLVAGGRSGEGEQPVLAGPRVCPRLSGRASYVPGTYGGDVKQSILAQRTGVWKRVWVTRQAVMS
jgi:hypothetical protein